jgi:DNA (cytosine-5)-methyltransferase 1
MPEHEEKLRKMMIRGDRLTVLDLFCGAGGFSEGFRTAGCRIVAGIDHWRPAVDTFNCNFELDGTATDMLTFEGNEELIESLPDTDIIVGSPPCVSFSYSNKLGNADKTEGLRLIKVFFSIVAIKAFKRNSCLVAWYMENVANALSSLPDSYTFKDLKLTRWAKAHGFDPNAVAIDIKSNAAILNSADFGVAQNRKRLFVSGLNAPAIRRRGFWSRPFLAHPTATAPISARAIRSKLPAPTCKASARLVEDPQHKGVRLPLRQITDHFYETGAYEMHWRDSRLLKTSHAYMGAMAFPENEDKPSRTIMASPFPRSREAILYKSEWNRSGDGEYRGPTIREAATLMSFPITYQFVGSEGAKWRLVGNAVCPEVSKALAVQLLKTLHVKIRFQDRTALPSTIEKVVNLNTFSPKSYGEAPKRQKLARFRSHPFKSAMMTVALANYDVTTRGALADGRWRCFVTYGIGQGYKIQPIDLKDFGAIRKAVEQQAPNGQKFVSHITNGFSERIPPAKLLQDLYEKNIDGQDGMLNPHRLLEETKQVVFQHSDGQQRLTSTLDLFLRDHVPVAQLYALFALCQIVSISESKSEHING